MTTPKALTVAVPGADELQVPPATVEENEVVCPIQIACPPLSVPALGPVVIVTFLMAVALEQGGVPATEYVMIAVPGEIPVMRPVVGLMVATAKLDETHVPPGVVDKNVVVDPTQAV